MENMNNYPPIEFINKVLLSDYKYGGLIDKLYSVRSCEKVHDPYVYFSEDKLRVIMNQKMTQNQIKSSCRKHKDFLSLYKNIGIVAGWMKDKETFILNDEIYKKGCYSISTKDGKIDLSNLPMKNMFHLPYKQFYIDFSQLSNWFKGDGPYHVVGCFVGYTSNEEYQFNMNEIDHKQPYALRIMYIATMRHKDGSITVEEDCNFSIPLYYEKHDDMLNEIWSNVLKQSEYKTHEKLLFNMIVLTYCLIHKLASDDVVFNLRTSNNHKSDISSKHSKDEVRAWDIAIRQGETIGHPTVSESHKEDEYEFMINPNAKDYPETHQTPRPHMRRAHTHHYWCGSGKNKHLEERWLTPIEVNHVDRIGPDEMPVVFHKTTDK